MFQTVELRTRYSAVFLNGNSMAEPVSGNPGKDGDEALFLKMHCKKN